MIKFKKLAILLVALMLVIPFTSCQSNDQQSSNQTSSEQPSSEQVSEPEESKEPEAPSKPDQDKPAVKLGVLKGPTGIGAVNLIDKSEGDNALNKYELTLAGSPDEITSQIISGDIDIAAVPTNVASILYNKTEGNVQLLALNTLGVLHLMSRDASVDSIAALKGKTIVTAGQGTVVEYALNYILTNNGLDPETDVTIEYKTEHSEVAALLISGEAEIAVLPEPFVTQYHTQNSDGASVLDLTKEWEAIDSSSTLTMGCLVVRKEFAENNAEVVKNFLSEYKESIDLANSDIDTTAQLCERYDIIKAAVAEKAIPNCNIVYMDSTNDFQGTVTGFLQVLFDANPASIGGNMPGEDFFFING